MQSKVTKEAYLEWIKGKKVNKYPKKIEGLDFPFLYEYGVPFMELDVLFYQENLHAGVGRIVRGGRVDVSRVYFTSAT